MRRSALNIEWHERKKLGRKMCHIEKTTRKENVCAVFLSRVAYRRYASLDDHQHKLHTISKHHFDRNVYGYYTSQAKNIDIFPYPNQVGGRKHCLTNTFRQFMSRVVDHAKSNKHTLLYLRQKLSDE